MPNAKVNTAAFFTFPEGSTIEYDRVILPDGRTILPIVGFMSNSSPEWTADEGELKKLFGVELIEYAYGADFIDELPR
jgi:hypothetical protein